MHPQPTDAPIVTELDLAALPSGQTSRVWIAMGEDGRGAPLLVPCLVARGQAPGPVVGLTAAIHGNELNGMPIIHRLFRQLDAAALVGAVIGVPVLNLPGFLRSQREFLEGKDLNRIMPGRPGGSSAEVYAHNILSRIVGRFDVLIDLHTASFGRVNSLYVRADMDDPVVARMARLQNPQIIVHNRGGDGTLRGAAAQRGIPSITVEAGDPQRFQRAVIDTSILGLRNVLEDLDMLPPDEHEPVEPVLCERSYWLYTDRGGVLEVLPGLAVRVTRGEVIARLRDLFGDVVCEYRAPEDGVVVGKSTNPVAETGARILHLGVVVERAGPVAPTSLKRLRDLVASRAA